MKKKKKLKVKKFEYGGNTGFGDDNDGYGNDGDSSGGVDSAGDGGDGYATGGLVNRTKNSQGGLNYLMGY